MREKLESKRAVIERQGEELDVREQSLEAAAADSHHTSHALSQMQHDADILQVFTHACRLLGMCVANRVA